MNIFGVHLDRKATLPNVERIRTEIEKSGSESVFFNINAAGHEERANVIEEIHKILGNRPKMYRGFIGGHCVIPNLDLIQNQTLDLIKSINEKYSKQVKNSKTIHKKYVK